MSNLYDTYRILYIHYILLLYSSTVYACVCAQRCSVLSVHFVWKDKSGDCSCCFSCCAAIQDVVENHLRATSPVCVLWSCQEETSNFRSLLGLETAKFLTCEDWLCCHDQFTWSDRIRSSRVVQFVQWLLLPTPCHRTNRFKSARIFPDMLETELLRGRRANWKRFHTVWTGFQEWLPSASFCRSFSIVLFMLFQSISTDIDISTNILYIYIQYNIYIYTVCIYIYMYAAKYVYIHISISINCKSTAVVLPGLNDDHFIPWKHLCRRLSFHEELLYLRNGPTG